MRKYRVCGLPLMALPLLLSDCHPSEPANQSAYMSDDANEDAALNAIREEDNEAQGAGIAISGMLPGAKGKVPMANVR